MLDDRDLLDVPAEHSATADAVARLTAVASDTATHCPYCALQCGMRLTPNGASGPTVSGNSAFPVNRGALCVKGWTSAATLEHPERLRTPFVRDAAGNLVPASWEDALDRVAKAFRETRARHGADAVGVFGGGSLTNEKAYLLGKFARVALGTSNIDYNGRFCMSSAAAAGMKAFGIDRGLPFPLDDIAGAQTILLIGSNIAETMPPVMRYLDRHRHGDGTLIIVDPRRTATAQSATLHLKLVPGSDIALANGLMHILVRDRLIDEDYIRQRTDGFARVRSQVASYWPQRVEQITGVPEGDLVRAAHLLGSAAGAMVLTARGAEQHARGVDTALSYINIALALGQVGKSCGGYGCLTGQGNGQGGREHGQKADQLPGYRKIDDDADRRHVAGVWGVPAESLPKAGLSAYELLDALGQKDGVRTLLVMGSNPVVSAPHATHIESRLRALDTLIVADFFLSETAALADVVLPSAQWAEESGTTTNLEGRVLLRRAASAPPPGVRTDLDILCGLAERLGKKRFFTFATPRAVFDELRRATAGGRADYSGITYERIEAHQGVFWPCPSVSSGVAPGHKGAAATSATSVEKVEPNGTPRLFGDRFFTPNGRARFHAVRHGAPAEEPDREYPIYLTTGRTLAQYQSGTQTRRIGELVDLAPEPFAELHPRLASRHRVKDGDKVTLATRRGRATFVARVTNTIREDTVFVPFHWSGRGSANRLTNPALDPTSRMPEFKVCAARIATKREDATDNES
jgi:assimilatory nitrate reductase catalytic subunit